MTPTSGEIRVVPEQLAQHERWVGAHSRLWFGPTPPTKIVAPRPVSPFERSRAEFIGPPTRLQWLFPEAIVEVDETGLAKSERALFAKPAWIVIAKEVGRKHGVSLRELRSVRRDREICRARHEAFWRCHKEAAMSLPQIGRCFGDRDHTTVLHGIHMHEKRMAEAEHGRQ